MSVLINKYRENPPITDLVWDEGIQIYIEGETIIAIGVDCAGDGVDSETFEPVILNPKKMTTQILMDYDEYVNFINSL